MQAPMLWTATVSWFGIISDNSLSSTSTSTMGIEHSIKNKDQCCILQQFLNK